MDEEWGPWIDHDGKSCPWGQVVRIVLGHIFGGETLAGPVVAGSAGGNSWFYDDPKNWKTWNEPQSGVRAMPILRYQVKKPKGLSLLEEILTEVKDTATPKEVAPRVKQGA